MKLVNNTHHMIHCPTYVMYASAFYLIVSYYCMEEQSPTWLNDNEAWLDLTFECYYNNVPLCESDISKMLTHLDADLRRKG